MTLQTVVCGIPNCKEAHLVDFCGLRESASWIQSTPSAKCLVFPLIFDAEHYQSLEIALTNIG
jgi:hypothetical protein